MKLFRNKIVIGILCILAGILISYAALPALQSNMQGTYASAVRMKEAVQAGTQITAEMVETVSIPQNLVPDGIRKQLSGEAILLAGQPLRIQWVLSVKGATDSCRIVGRLKKAR